MSYIDDIKNETIMFEKAESKPTKGLEALKRIKPYADSSIDGELDIIEKELKDFEWLKSKVSIEWFDKLSNDDKIKFMEIMGVKYEQ